MRLSFIAFLVSVFSFESASSQNAYYKLGQQAIMDGNFKAAVAQLEKACLIDSTNSSALWMLGYSYYHSENYKKSIVIFNKEILISPTDAMAYYYRARAKSYLGRDNQISQSEKEKFMVGAIFDLTKAIGFDPNGNENKYYQTRGIAYREFGMFKIQATGHYYDKAIAISSLKASIKDFEKILADNPGRTDIATLLDVSKQKLEELSAKK